MFRKFGRRSLALRSATSDESVGKLFDLEELLKLGYRDLQKLAKENNVRREPVFDGVGGDQGSRSVAKAYL